MGKENEKAERMKRIGSEVKTILYFEKETGVLATLGPAIYLGEEVPAKNEVLINGIDANELGFTAPKLKLQQTGDIVYGNMVHWLWADQTVMQNGQQVNLWDAYVKASKKVIEIDYNEFYLEYKRGIREFLKRK